MYQYTSTVLDALRRATEEGSAPDITLLWAGPDIDQGQAHPTWLQAPLVAEGKARSLARALPEGKLKSALRRLVIGTPKMEEIAHKPQIRDRLVAAGIDMLFFPAPHPMSFEIGLPFIMTVHDLQHRLQPDWPEVSGGGEAQRREHLYRNAARTAVTLIADSEVGREDLLSAYGDVGLTEERVCSLPFVPPAYLRHVTPAEATDRVAAYGVTGPFLFYPAQFWPHKNHLRLVQALGHLKETLGISIPLVLSGSSSGGVRGATFKRFKEEATAAGVLEQLSFLGYIPDDDMSCFYRAATGLVMPTFFGPTNIPILEAWSLDCPVVTSDIRGVRDQAGDAAILVDPTSVESIAAGIHRLWVDEGLRSKLIERGRERVRGYTPDDFRRRLVGIISESEQRLAR
jgi:glycosyltransferase involved in cell wall biosynthesis